MTALREESFRIILFIAVAAILLIVVFYILYTVTSDKDWHIG